MITDKIEIGGILSGDMEEMMHEIHKNNINRYRKGERMLYNRARIKSMSDMLTEHGVNLTYVRQAEGKMWTWEIVDKDKLFITKMQYDK